MAVNASGVLGSPVLAGVQVNPLGFAARQVRVQGGGGGGLMVTDQVLPGPSDTPAFGRLAYLAVTDQEVALVSLTNPSGFSPRAGQVVARVPRSQVQTIELSPGYAAPLTVTFTDGSIWRLEVALAVRKSAKAVVGAAGGRILTKSDLPARQLPQMTRFRVVCGILWAVIAAITLAGGVGELTVSNVAGAVLAFVIGVLSAWYDYRIWTRKAKRLLLVF